ncbi:hypothetical protein TSA66_01195 [Noviherbaspirillum autotrophicum]|uniref:Uncharacterized protein n=1 Tax=Noviherbaspirillum autotrophicum TaxID=709839 RepID=A0A0C1YAI3_9BURK|nr:hypothetical protein TSA66_16570 [Noviherbaspirillum autotrophicum]KIF84008.1 hypothetical protein TSA66_01195 [Noviherbaspirillum autotrophicum]
MPSFPIIDLRVQQLWKPGFLLKMLLESLALLKAQQFLGSIHTYLLKSWFASVSFPRTVTRYSIRCEN